MLEVVLALVAAALFALGTVLQQAEASKASDDEALSLRFLLSLARRPRWLVGIGADAGGFVAQAAALGVGRLVVVQPLLATMVLFALPLGRRLTGQRVTRRQVYAAIAVAGGLGAFLVLADPEGGRDDASTGAWLAAFAIAAAICVPLLLAGRRARPDLKASLLGIAAGILFGLSAGLTKAVVEDLDEGVVSVLTDWHAYALAVVGYASMSLSQASLQAGRLAPAVATQSVLDPITSVLLGVIAFQEGLHDTTAQLAGSLAGLAVMIGGLVVLAGAGQSSATTSRSPEASAANRSAV